MYCDFGPTPPTPQLLYLNRYGRTKMEAKLKELFGEGMRETGTQVSLGYIPACGPGVSGE